MEKPNLFIIGAPKCATTFLYKTLTKDKNFFFPKIKELNYFSYSELLNKSYYHEYKIKTKTKYLSFFKNRNEKYLVDSSVSYFSNLSSHQKIFKFNNNAKIILMYRDPIARSFSHYKMDVRMGYANQNFLYYLDKKKNPLFYNQYILNSLYGRTLSNLLLYFKSEDIILINQANLKNDLRKMFEKLNLNGYNFNDNYFLNKMNTDKRPSNIVSRYLLKNRSLTSKLKLFIPKLIINLYKKISFDKKNIDIIMSSKERKILAGLTNNDFKKFNELKSRLNL